MSNHKKSLLKYFYRDYEIEENTGNINFEVEELETITKNSFQTEKAYILLYKLDKVELGYYQDGDIKFYSNNGYISSQDYLSMRVFNKEKELYIWKAECSFKYRYKSDNYYDIEKHMKGLDKLIIVYDEYHMMLGKVISNKNGWCLFHDNRGSEIFFPEDYNIGEILFYKVRNYADEDMNFIDARLCGFYTESELVNKNLIRGYTL